MKNVGKIAILLGIGLLFSLSASASRNFAMINTGSRTRRAIKIGSTTYYTNYPLLPIVDNEWTRISIPDTIRAIKGQNLPENLAKSVFAVILSEAARDRTTGNFKGINNNYAGVQTDSGVWGFANFSGQTAKIDSGGDARMFAQFDDFQSFIEFLANRLAAKGFGNAANAQQWADTYIRKWWGRTPTPALLRSKGNIYATAIKFWQKN
jgi:hypothetical protein